MTPSAQGTLDKRPLVHLLVYAMDRGLTGTLAFQDQLGEAVGSLVVVDGWPAKGDIEPLFDLPDETQFAYYDQHDVLPDVPVERRDPLPLVWRGIVHQPPWQHVHTALTRLGSTPLRLTGEDIDRFQFDDPTLFAVETLRARAMSAHDLVATEALPPGKTQLLLYCLLITKRAAASATSDSLPVPAPAPPSSSDLARPTPVARVPLRTRSITKSDVVEERRVSTSDPRASMSPPPTRAAAPVISDEVLQARRAEITARAGAVEKQDYFDILGVARDATTQEIQTTFFLLAKTWHPDRLPPALADVRDACSRVFARMSEAHQALSDPDKRAQYMRLMKEGGASPSEQDEIAAVVEAATSFQKAEVFLKRGDFKQAEVLVRRALELDPKQADYHALSAWLQSMKQENQGEPATRVQIAVLDGAIATNEKCERAYFYRGMLLKRIGDLTAAHRDFKRASELNPRNVDAQREVRLYTMRNEKSGTTSPGAGDKERKSDPGRAKDKPKEKDEAKGLFGRFFKK